MKKKDWLIIASTIFGGIAFLYNIFSNKEPEKYSSEWINNLNDDEWETEREIVRQNFCNPKFDVNTREGFKKILDIFDRIKSNRDWDGKEPQGPAFHRDGGWYILNDDE